MQYFTPLSISSRCNWAVASAGGWALVSGFSSTAVASIVFMMRPRLSGCGRDGVPAIGMVERRRLGAALANQRGEVGHQPVEPALALLGTGEARRAGDAVQAGAVDRVGENAAAGAVGVVGAGQLVRA